LKTAVSARTKRGLKRLESEVARIVRHLTGRVVIFKIQNLEFRVMSFMRAILLDIEGTTTPVDYVFGTLFPYAKNHVAAFLTSHGQEVAVQADLVRLRQEYDQEQDCPVVPFEAIAYIHYLIDCDRKSTGLKSLQGKIWEQGYRDGTLLSQVFADVQPALARWTTAGKQVFIFSSGSVQAQQLLFQYSTVGDLTPYLSGYFDTQVGAKREADSYRAIAQSINLDPSDILFISDITAELKAAQIVGMQVLFSHRPGNQSSDSEGFPSIITFEEL
jgi:enolase-phosphatase E1